MESDGQDSRAIKNHVRQHYGALHGGAAVCPLSVLQGKPLAKELGYPLKRLEFVPDELWRSFLPCGNPLKWTGPPPGDEVILNLGCGTGIDSFALWALHGDSVRIVGMDVIFEPLGRACKVADELSNKGLPGLTTGHLPLSWLCADGERLPFREAVFHRVIMNGVFNLFPEKTRILQEIGRVLQPRGVLVITDLCSKEPLPDYFRDVPDAWVWCMSGACTADQLKACLWNTGFVDICMEKEKDEDNGEGEEGEQFYRVAATCRKSPG